MSIKKILKNFVTSNVEYSDSTSYRRIIMINSMMSLSTVILFLFAYTNFFITKNYEIAMFDAIAGIASIANLIYLRVKKNVEVSAFLAVVIMIVFMITFIMSNQNTNFGIIWSIFIPFLAIRFNGKTIGLYLTIFFYSIMFYLAYDGIGTWNNGQWITIDFMRFTISATVLTLIIYMGESAYGLADEELQKVRVKEQKIVQELEKKAITDVLTKMYNRRYFNQKSVEILKDVKKNDNFLAFLILDIDYFKNYNDYYGHQAGDEALVAVARELIDFTEKEGYAFRMGGEEFSILVESRNINEVVQKCQTLNKRIEDLVIEHNDSTIATNLTVSCGLCVKKVEENENIERFYKIADEALYAAKDSGRNRLEIIS